MQAILNTLTAYCVNKGYVSDQDAPWLKYGIEKRLVGVVVTIPVLAFGLYVSNISQTIAFYIGFRFLRSRTNGLHAKTVVGCLLASLFCEGFFLGILLPVINGYIINSLLAVAAFIILILAPYRHPNMGLSDEEVEACSKSAKIRLGILLLAWLIMNFFKLYDLANGFALSVVMTAAMLVLAYILQKGGKDDGRTKKREENNSR